MTPYIGQISLFASNRIPNGWALCNGQMVNKNQNQALFSIIGTTYGGDGNPYFALPDFRGRLPVHPDKVHRLGVQDGSATTLLSIDQMAAHTHPIVTNDLLCNSNRGNSSSPNDGFPANSGSDNSYTTTANGIMSEKVVGVYFGQTGSNVPFNNMMPSLSLNFIIALQGIMPSPS
jgi:microcystin-dependent protein